MKVVVFWVVMPCNLVEGNWLPEDSAIHCLYAEDNEQDPLHCPCSWTELPNISEDRAACIINITALSLFLWWRAGHSETSVPVYHTTWHYVQNTANFCLVSALRFPKRRERWENYLINLIKMTNKMQLSRTVFYSIVSWLLNMFRVILLLIIRSI